MLDIDLCWPVAGRWYSLRVCCLAGLTQVDGPAATTLLRLLAGRPLPHQGIARLDGRPLYRGRAVARHGPRVRPVAVVLADDTLPLWRTPLGLVTGAVRNQGVLYSGARIRAMQALRWTDATPCARRPIALLSAADRRRVALARALAVIPGLLLLERPSAPLPARDHAALYATLGELAARWEMIVLLIPDAARADLPVLMPQPL